MLGTDPPSAERSGVGVRPGGPHLARKPPKPQNLCLFGSPDPAVPVIDETLRRTQWLIGCIFEQRRPHCRHRVQRAAHSPPQPGVSGYPAQHHVLVATGSLKARLCPLRPLPVVCQCLRELVEGDKEIRWHQLQQARLVAPQQADLLCRAHRPEPCWPDQPHAILASKLRCVKYAALWRRGVVAETAQPSSGFAQLPFKLCVAPEIDEFHQYHLRTSRLNPLENLQPVHQPPACRPRSPALPPGERPVATRWRYCQDIEFPENCAQLCVRHVRQVTPRAQLLLLSPFPRLSDSFIIVALHDELAGFEHFCDSTKAIQRP
ncbi:hypothetical protein AURANDRAFT_67348 [Aureococcus anophagefferens]|uniref:Uncharacterized protein n=1 Tax=Aureococcus anophagefferens TaxID=44056 RepID=F0YKU7_AURAN|nr:hypothetical protein AURANDRAFT_67348 [Aureococcus anophagefferens]EGB04304.1 hypothetical protein AURANDRAFT_67348 [Aureococcus anophagefferens]|eukprot:XP_009041014.1 hypothetical protein AURANDRAFT_67348 [Aureococcus anophagefferens]